MKNGEAVCTESAADIKRIIIIITFGQRDEAVQPHEIAF
jgi:hypothetical protein